MINTENFITIKLRFENIFIFDDKYVFSKSNNVTQSDLKLKPLILSDTAPEKNNIEFVKKYFPDNTVIINNKIKV
jgi:hypothetical protein